jgi:hypothetical protein
MIKIVIVHLLIMLASLGMVGCLILGNVLAGHVGFIISQ